MKKYIGGQITEGLLYGWEAVNEYEIDELAANEDDAKRLEKAEKAAKQKELKRKKAAFFQ